MTVDRFYVGAGEFAIPVGTLMALGVGSVSALTGYYSGDRAVLLFRADSPKVVEDFAKADPYVTHGLVRRWHVREWTTVAGTGAETPIRP